MGEIRTPAKVKIIVGILAKDANSVETVREVLKSRFGEEDLNLEPFPFTFTNYYKEEIGEAPVRAFFSYENLVDRETIVDIKLWTNDIELEIAKENGTPGLRPVNLDPGYMTLGQFFLATTKDQRQRVYMQRGIFVEPTLYFHYISRMVISTLLTGLTVTTRAKITSSISKKCASAWRIK